MLTRQTRAETCKRRRTVRRLLQQITGISFEAIILCGRVSERPPSLRCLSIFVYCGGRIFARPPNRFPLNRFITRERLSGGGVLSRAAQFFAPSRRDAQHP